MRGNYRYKQLTAAHFFPLNNFHTAHSPLPAQLAINSPISVTGTETHQQTERRKSASTNDGELVKWNVTITNHMRNGRCDLAFKLFSSMPRQNPVSWNAMISGYLSNGKFNLAKRMFDEMPQRDLVSWNLMINCYVQNGNLGAARTLFEKMDERDSVSWNTMLSGYARNGLVYEARELFNRMPNKNYISWNGLLAAYVQNGRVDEACELFEAKKGWELVSWNCLMGGYVKKKRMVDARELFDRMPCRDIVSWNTMVSGYAQDGDLLQARRLFEEAPGRDVFTWTAMVSGYVQNGMLNEARRMFDEMPEKNPVAWNSMIAGYVQEKNIDQARELFEVMPCRTISSWNTMITGYMQSGDVIQARAFFDKMPQRDLISWSAIIAGYAQAGHSEEALNLFIELRRNGEIGNKSLATCVLSVCADIGVQELGMQVHGQLVRTGFETAIFIGNALLGMYCKCGSIEEANCVFENMKEKDNVSWNTMIVGFARHGFGREALAVFETMTEAAHAKPDDITMIGVLSACGHAGLVDRGKEYFETMTSKYDITPNSRHYTCMIDLLGRSGRLEEAQNLMKRMPFEPEAATWGALLAASRKHGDLQLGEKAAKILFKMEPDNSGMYVLLSNLYASSGRWDDVRMMRTKMRDTGVKKLPGYSWVEVQNKIHTFSVGDNRHPDKDQIYAFLEEMELRMKREGYVSSTRLVLHDVDEEEKEHMLRYHSEKLAVAFGILTIPSPKPIRVMKNLRVCEDCHNVIKLVSKIVGRLIILRDSNRFHHFSGGSCSCGDYW